MEDTVRDALTWRYATKTFIKEKRVPNEILESIIEAGRMAPTAYGLQPFRIVHIVNPALREQLKAVSFGQPQVTDAGDLFLIARRTDITDAFVDEYVGRISTERGVPLENLKGFGDMMKGDIIGRDEAGRAMWAGRQAYIALGAMIETTALLHVDGFPMEGFMPGKVDEVLGLPALNLASLGYFAVGYRDESDVVASYKKVRVSRANIVVEK
ncbi:MAG: nitroreductase family protein [Minisyncoccia bacterium]